MIVIKVELWSALTGKVTNLQTVVIDNVASNAKGSLCDYRARVYRRGEDPVIVKMAKKPVRETVVKEHARHALSVLTLVKRALQQMRY